MYFLHHIYIYMVSIWKNLICRKRGKNESSGKGTKLKTEGESEKDLCRERYD